MFTGKIELPQIELDLVEMSGGGSCPSQFHGVTSDGKEVYIRYRGGSLSISVDNEKVSASYKDGVLTVNLPKAHEAKLRKIKVD